MVELSGDEHYGDDVTSGPTESDPFPQPAPRTDDRCWPFPCRDYHGTAIHLDGTDPCNCPCHVDEPERGNPERARADLFVETGND